MQSLFEKIKEEAVNHAKEESPKECCGLLIIINGKVQYKRCKNIASFGDFAIDPVDYAACSDLGEIVAVFHSHNTGSSEPSISDKIGIEKWGIP